jgi:Kdo2-lipid IVA lauroyltransferase/acyltransferase
MCYGYRTFNFTCFAMRDKFILWLVRRLARLPLGVAQRLGGLLGWLFYVIPNRQREYARINIDRCLPDWSPARRRELLRQSLAENARTLLEMPAIWLRDPAEVLARIDDNGGRELLRQTLAQGKGALLAAPHLGNWETGIHYLASVTPTTALYRPPRLEVLDEVIKGGRSRGGGTLVPTTAGGVKALYEALQEGQVVVILPDQQPKVKGKGAGVFAPFFGLPALTMVLVNRLARKTGAPLLYIYMERLPRAQGWRVNLLPAPPGLDHADPEQGAAALNLGVEQCVRRCPAQYQWTYKRFEAQPDDGTSPYRRP